jgi:hypothetical protein
MITLVRPSGKIKPIGAESEVFKSRLDDIGTGDVLEIVNQDGLTLNIAQVTDVTQQDGVEVLQIRMIA